MTAPARLPVRLPDWEVRLDAFIATGARVPFAPGRMDCALFAAGAVAAMTGTDPAAAFRGRYATLAAGRRALRRAGIASPEAAVTGLFAPVAPQDARPGDIALVPAEAGHALGVVQGELVYVRGPDGLGLVPLSRAARAWTVP